jgi:cell cycle sensor histidine kinase DivJ
MPNKNVGSVNMLTKVENKTVGPLAALFGTLIAFGVSCVAMLSGGLGAVAAVLWLVGIVLVWLICGARAVGSAILATMLGVAGVAIMQATQILPPPSFSFGARIELWMFVGLALLGVASMFRLRVAKPHQLRGDRVEPTRETDLWRDAPIAAISLTPYGRVRALAGSASLLGDLKVGQTFDIDTLKRGDVSVDIIADETGRRIFLSKMQDQFGDGRAQLEAQLRERTDFFAGLGHDLKSPLNAVIGFADMMDQEISGPMPDVYREYPGLIKESGETLLRFVEDMLGYARSEAGAYELDLAIMDVAASGEAVLRQSEAAARMAGVDLVLDAQGEVLAMADAAAVRRIWDNLVSNAIKYAAQGGQVKLSAREDAGAVVIEVSDDGAGMDAADLAAIARPFEQGRNARGRAGTGLGLAMVRRLTELHGGQVRIETAKGEGTTVSVRLPAPAEAMRKAAE